jgi:hypothetical protein
MHTYRYLSRWLNVLTIASLLLSLAPPTQAAPLSEPRRALAGPAERPGVPLLPVVLVDLADEALDARDDPRTVLPAWWTATVGKAGSASQKGALAQSYTQSSQDEMSRVVYACTSERVIRTSNISATSPVWQDITPAGIGTINDCVPDPIAPEHGCGPSPAAGYGPPTG